MLLAALRGKQESWMPGRGSHIAVHIARPNPMQICACAWIYRWAKKLDIRPTCHRASGPLGRWAAGPPGRHGPRAAGRWAFGPPGRRGPWTVGRWAAGLLLAKPLFSDLQNELSLYPYYLVLTVTGRCITSCLSSSGNSPDPGFSVSPKKRRRSAAIRSKI